jgi:hypothetical protein
MTSFRKILIACPLGLAVGWFLFNVAINGYYYYGLPATPMKDTGHVYEMADMHGSKRFGTANEFRAQQIMKRGLDAAGLVFLGFLLLGLKLGVLHVRGEKTERKDTRKSD